MGEKGSINLCKATDSSRDVQGSLTVSLVISCLNGWESAPSAQEVFDRYWAGLIKKKADFPCEA